MKIIKAPLFSYRKYGAFLIPASTMGIKENIILFDDPNRGNLLPFAFTRPVAELRIGITTIKEKWELMTGSTCSYQTVGYLSKKYRLTITNSNLFINSSLLPDERLLERVSDLKQSEGFMHKNILLAYKASDPIALEDFQSNNAIRFSEYESDFTSIASLWDIFTLNDKVLRDDFIRITSGRKSEPLSKTNNMLGAENIFIEKGAKAECSIINAERGPVYIGPDAEIMEGSIVRGPFALCARSALKMGSKIYGAVTIGPGAK